VTGLCEVCIVVEGVVGLWFLPTSQPPPPFRTCTMSSCHLPLRSVVERVRSRVGHGFTDLSVIQDMHQQFVIAVNARHVITEPDNRPARLAELIKGQPGRDTFS
jgi:hypothetical protein